VTFFSLNYLVASEKGFFSSSKVDYQQGLSNSAVLCLFQDNEGLMWFGTYDGVNCWDGKAMEVFRSDFSKQKTLSNNVIHSIQQADSNCLWITTHLGANRFSKDSRQVICNYEFGGDFVIHSNQKGNTWALGYGWLSYYNTYHRRFVNVPMPDIHMLKVDTRAFVTDEGELYLFPYKSGDLYRFSLNSFNRDTLNTRLNVAPSHFHPKTIEYVCYQNGVFCFYDSDKDLFVYDISRKSKIYIRNIADMVHKYGNTTGIVPFYEDIMIAFQTNGLIRLRMSQKYAEEIVNRNIRIFAIYNDPRQGVLWIGSDGQGAIMYSKKNSIATNVMLNSLSPNLSRQVRSVLTDKYGGLWFGTKGDGLLHIKNYRDGIRVADAEIYSPDGKQNVSSYVKLDHEFQVYAMTESRYMNGFWIGTGGPSGLCYYSFDDGELHLLSEKTTQGTDEIHSIFEVNDTVLYVASAGNGLCKIILDKSIPKNIRIKSSHHYHFFHEQQELNLFYSMVPEGDSLLWLGSRQKGLVRFNRNTDEYQIYSLNEMLHKSVDDILCLHWYKKNQLYVGTTSGLVRITFEGRKLKADYIGREQGLLNDMIHSILEDDNKLLWLGTNRGLIKFNPDNFFSHAYYYSSGIQIGEFSDDAYYHCPYTGNLFFGGIDGLLYLDKKVSAAPEYYPEILLRKLVIGKTFVNLQEHYFPDKKGLKMKGTKISFSLFFVVPDYASGGDVEYSYMLEGYDQDWGTFSSINEASYFNVPPGKYLFKVRYKKDVFATEYKTFTIHVHILPPWYLTVYAYIIYLLLALTLAVYIIHLFRKYFRHEQIMQKLLETEHRNASLVTDGYKEREVLNNCTLIYQACDQLNDKNLSPAEYTGKVNQIRESVMSLLFGCGIGDECFHLLSSLQFSVTGCLYISKLSEEVLQVLKKEGYNISAIHLEIPDNFTFPAYKNALRCILYFSCLYISSQNETEVSLTVKEEENKMLLTFLSSNDVLKGLHEVLSGQEKLFVKGKNSDDLFRIRTMQRFVLSALKQQNCTFHLMDNTAKQENQLIISFEQVIITEQNETRKTILLLEDKEEMIWLISALLSDEYEVYPVRSVQAAFDEMHTQAPSLFLVDMLMYADAESTFIKYVNKNRPILSKTAFIPMLSWQVSSTMQRELILWADSYLVLPYDIPFLKETIHKTLYGKQEARQVYLKELENWTNSIICTTTEQADFVRKFLQIMEQNLDREDLGSTFIAEQMLMSPRQFYRKLKEISGMSPSDLIKEYRMEKAARLLQDETLSIQEVISDVGISSRAYFYKEFTRKFGMTPKIYREKLLKNDEYKNKK
jgi:two component transcriptional regulator, AraC family